MALNPDYVLAPSLEMYFVDKDSGLPLANGLVYFYQDNARNIPKPVYELAGNFPNYVYNPLPNPVVLSGVGTFQDNNGNDILPYYFPFDSSGNVQLYYVAVYSAGGVFQWSRAAWPNFIETTAGNDVTNFVANGQFLLHNNPATNSAGSPLPVSLTTVSAQTSTTLNYGTGGSAPGNLDVWTIAQGGWTFEKNHGSSSVDTITFPVFPSYQNPPTGGPRYAMQLATTMAGTDTSKDICLKFPNVNTFSSITGQVYNLYIEGICTSSSSPIVEVIIRKYYGVGGSATTEVQQGTFSLASTWKNFNITLDFGSNGGQTIGTGNDDFVQVVLRLPPTGVQTIEFTDVAITVNSTQLNNFPSQTEAEQIAPATAGQLPTQPSDGSDFYLPTVLTSSGLTYDNSSIGTIVGKVQASVTVGGIDFGTNNELFLNGQIIPGANKWSPIGVPYYRLLNYLLTNSPITNVPLWGTGSNYSTAYTYGGSSLTNFFRLTNNSAGTSVSLPVNVSAGITVQATAINVGAATLNYTAYSTDANALLAVGSFASPLSAPTNGTTAFTVNPLGTTNGYQAFQGTTDFTVTTTNAAVLANPGGAGLYWTFSNASTDFYMWFKFTNETDPAPGGTGIEIFMPSTNLNAQDVANVIREAINRFQIAGLSFSAVPTAGTYWTFASNQGGTASSFYVWYTVNGAGSDPAPGGTGINVALTSSDTTATTVTKTQLAINSYQYALGDYRGMFLRGLDPNGTWDLDYYIRWSLISGGGGANLGTYEFQQFLQHYHSILGYQAGATTTQFPYGGNGMAPASQTVAISGGTETRPVNAGVNWFIKF